MKLNTFQNIEQLEDELCSKLADDLLRAINTYQSATLLVSGGSTPKKLYNKLSKIDLPWRQITVGLVDDRYVDNSHLKSNDRFLRNELLINKASKAVFLPLVHTTVSKELNMEAAIEAYLIFKERVDVVVLGMGTDGHTASLFPNDPNSQEALRLDNDTLLSYTNSDVEPIERISCTKRLLDNSPKLYLMISGKEKLQVLRSAKENALPIASFFRTRESMLEVYHTQ